MLKEKELLLIVLFLQVFLVFVALLAGFALFMLGDAALVLAVFALGGGLLTAGQLFCGLIARQGRAHQKGSHGPRNDQHFDQFHDIQLSTLQQMAWPQQAPTPNARDGIYL